MVTDFRPDAQTLVLCILKPVAEPSRSRMTTGGRQVCAKRSFGAMSRPWLGKENGVAGHGSGLDFPKMDKFDAINGAPVCWCPDQQLVSVSTQRRGLLVARPRSGAVCWWNVQQRAVVIRRPQSADGKPSCGHGFPPKCTKRLFCAYSSPWPSLAGHG